MPEVAPIPYAEMDPHSQRLYHASDMANFDITPEDVARSRRAYYANISYIDDKIGEILDTLERTRQEAIILFVSDHGDMLGERGAWFKMSFLEGSARVPMMICAPDLEPALYTEPVSTLDVLPTVCDLAGIDLSEIMEWTDGISLKPLAQGGRGAQHACGDGICR